MTDKQIQTIVEAIKGIHLKQIISSPSFDLNQVWYAIISGFASGFIAVGIFWLLDRCRENRREKIHYQNMLLLIVFELFENFKMLTTLPSNYPLQFSFDNWEKFKIEVSKKLSPQTLSNIELAYNIIKPVNKVDLGFVKESCKKYNMKFSTFIALIHVSILELKEIVDYKDECLENMYLQVKQYNINQD
ncbi:MAG TPA: hypothetical protein DDW65_18900 [Firmicutes bacterium]|nr:hypothetical protein [Bacillota bacterium]